MSRVELKMNLKQAQKLAGGTMEILKDEELKNYTTLHIGGKARNMVMAGSEDDFAEALRYAKEKKLDYFVLGNGSNVLFDDEGYNGLIIRVDPSFNKVDRLENNQVRVEAGATNEQLANWLCRQGLGGYEFASGVPGTIGGAIFMNAGCYGSETSEVLKSVRWMDPDGKIHVSTNEELDFGYRHSMFSDHPGIILDAVYEFEERDPEVILENLKDLKNRRYEKQPMEKHSAGSTFKRPEGYFAGTLIDQSGLRGYSVGDAKVSDKHCGFLINDGECSAKEFLQLIEEVQDIVEKKHGVRLECEVRHIPFIPDPAENSMNKK